MAAITSRTNTSNSWLLVAAALVAKKTSELGLMDLCQSQERIHRSNLISMGILPFQFLSGQGAHTYKLDGTEPFSIEAVEAK